MTVKIEADSAEELHKILQIKEIVQARTQVQLAQAAFRLLLPSATGNTEADAVSAIVQARQPRLPAIPPDVYGSALTVQAEPVPLYPLQSAQPAQPLQPPQPVAPTEPPTFTPAPPKPFIPPTVIEDRPARPMLSPIINLILITGCLVAGITAAQITKGSGLLQHLNLFLAPRQELPPPPPGTPQTPENQNGVG